MKCTNLDTADDQRRLDAHTPLPSVVCGTSHERPSHGRETRRRARTEARLVREHVSRYEHSIGRKRLRALVHVQERAEPVTSAVLDTQDEPKST